MAGASISKKERNPGFHSFYRRSGGSRSRAARLTLSSRVNGKNRMNYVL